jgi:hypothetical protein
MTYSALHREKTQTANERCIEALRLRQEGLTFREIGEHFGVGVERARQLTWRGSRITGGTVPETKGTIAVAKGIVTRKARERAENAARLAAWKAEEARYEAGRAHRELWYAFTTGGVWRRPRNWRNRNGSLHAWIDWRGHAGITYRNIPGRLVPEWRTSA